MHARADHAVSNFSRFAPCAAWQEWLAVDRRNSPMPPMKSTARRGLVFQSSPQVSIKVNSLKKRLDLFFSKATLILST